MSLTALTDTLSEFRRSLPKAARVYVAGCSGEPLAIVEALRGAPDLAAGLTFLGIWVPGLNATDWASLHPTSRAESIFISAALRPSFAAGETQFMPLSYSQSTRWLSSTPIDAGIVMISPPDDQGLVSLGVSVDFSTLIIARDSVPLFGVINPSLKPPVNGPKVPLDRFQFVAEAQHALVQVEDADLPDTFAAIGAHIAALCDPGDTLQFGLGNVQQAVLKALRDHHGLRLHAGMVSNPLVDLLDRGAIESDYGAIATGVAIGTDQLYDRVIEDDRILFAPATYTHALSTLTEIPRFKAINSCLEVDLFGQANAEFLKGRQISGTGGLVDFLRGAAASEGGRGMLALASTARNGSLSRIVPRLPRTATSVARADVDTVITEHGVADLKHKSMDARAEALIAIADPSFRDQLANDWYDLRKEL